MVWLRRTLSDSLLELWIICGPSRSAGAQQQSAGVGFPGPRTAPSYNAGPLPGIISAPRGRGTQRLEATNLPDRHNVALTACEYLRWFCST